MNRLLESSQIMCFQSFILNINRKEIYSTFTEDVIDYNSNTKIISKVTINKKLQKMGFTIINDNYLDLSKSQIALHKPVSFYFHNLFLFLNFTICNIFFTT
jgi:D-arabinose 1-dehydrogenase-like Zn-dependent alcohol dehydrogenase